MISEDVHVLSDRHLKKLEKTAADAARVEGYQRGFAEQGGLSVDDFQYLRNVFFKNCTSDWPSDERIKVWLASRLEQMKKKA